MIRLLLVLLFLAGISLAATWIADHPGEATLYWFDWRIDTSFAFLMVLAIAGTWIAIYLYTLMRDLISAPRHFAERRRLKSYQQGLAELTYSVAALAASDTKGAESHTKKAEKLLGATPMGLLLSAQIAKSRGDDNQTRNLLEHMLAHKETEYLAARSLSDAASAQQALPRALQLAERAYELNPKEASALAAVISLQIRLRQWPAALDTLARARKQGIRRADIARWQGLVLLKQGMQRLAEGDAGSAGTYARQVVKLLKGFVPATLFAARAFDADGDREYAVKIIMKHWKHAPHPQLLALFQSLIAREPPRKQTRLLRALTPPITSHAGGWACRACGHKSAEWDTHCAVCGAFDSQEWK